MNIFAKSPTKLSSINLIYSGKVIHEKKPFRGVSHLAEHLMSYAVRDLESEYDKYGIVSNACTGPLYVSFYLQGLERYVKKFAEDFITKIMSFTPSRELFERERKVVLEEYKDCFTDQISSYLLNQSRINYDYCGAIGYREDLENLSYEQYLEFQKTFFSKPDKLLYVGSKPIDFKLDFATTDCNKIFNFSSSSTLKLEQQSEFKEKAVVHLHTQLAGNELPYAKFACALLSKGMDSPLFRTVREENALAYFVNCGAPSFSYNFATMDILTQVSDENLQFTFEVIENVLNNVEKFITRKRFNDMITSYKITLEKDDINRYSNISKFITPYENTIDYLLDNKLLTYSNVIDFLKSKQGKFYHFSDKKI
ncbi:MAG: insulinase family protein [Lentisphaeria bacterium]|nr:insulinase family protein [Lentisphaeria bacterium]